jgi:hypothetical protein
LNFRRTSMQIAPDIDASVIPIHLLSSIDADTHTYSGASNFKLDDGLIFKFCHVTSFNKGAGIA